MIFLRRCVSHFVGEKLVLSFDWCPMRQGADKGDTIDPVDLLVVADGEQKTTFEVPEADREAATSSNGSVPRSR